MSTAENITKQVEAIEPGVIFSYKDFKIPNDQLVATANTLSRLAAKGIIHRFEKGKYYKTTQGMVGELHLNENQFLTSILKAKGYLIGYLSGTTAHNRLSLTTQMPAEYTIATTELRKSIKIGRFRARFVKSYSSDITADNIILLQILDSIKDINHISATSTNDALIIMKTILKRLPLIEQKKIVQFALNYPPSTRALTGAIFELNRNKKAANTLFKTLNPLSKYKFGVSIKTLPNKDKWKII